MTSTGSIVRVGIAGLLSATLAACGDVPGEETETQVSEIFGANPSNARGAVCIRQSRNGNCCSGSIINNQILLTAAHCFGDSSSSGFRNVFVEYQGPHGTLNWEFYDDPARGIFNQAFMYPHPNWPNDRRVEWDMALITLFEDQSLGLPARDFVTLHRGSLKENHDLETAGYGGGPFQANNVHRRAILELDWIGTHHVKWHNLVIGQMICSGDSGGPGMRLSGYEDVQGTYWNAQGLVTESVYAGTPQPGIGVCGSRGRSSRVSPKFTWIRDTVETWTGLTCTEFTNPNGERAAWCWDPL